jgi:DNA polymerase/3'-5' exonuclease PolX
VRYLKGLATPTNNTSIQSHSAGAFVVPWRHAIAAPLTFDGSKSWNIHIIPL